jgi:transcription elongation factor Elf1
VGGLVIRAVEDEARVLARKIMAKAPAFSCPACGHRDFGLIEQPEAGFRTWLSREDRRVGEKTSQPLVTLVCTNCGHIEQFAEAVVEGAEPAQYGEAVGNE